MKFPGSLIPLCTAVVVNFPVQIASERFRHGVSHVRSAHRRVVLVAVQADVLHQGLEIGNFHYRAGAKRIQPVVGEHTLANVGPDHAVDVIRGHTGKGQRTRRHTPGDSAVGVFGAQRGGQDLSGGNLDIGQEALGPVAAVEQHAFIGVVCVVVVPVHQRAGGLRSQLQGIHGNHAGNVDFAGGRHELVAHHAHQGADVNTV